jgi:hypothetical protein
MFAIVIMLIIALMPTGADGWPVAASHNWQPGIPAECFYASVEILGDINSDVCISAAFLQQIFSLEL